MEDFYKKAKRYMRLEEIIIEEGYAEFARTAAQTMAANDQNGRGGTDNGQNGK